MSQRTRIFIAVLSVAVVTLASAALATPPHRVHDQLARQRVGRATAR
jgi:hypothetical protein